VIVVVVARKGKGKKELGQVERGWG